MTRYLAVPRSGRRIEKQVLAIVAAGLLPAALSFIGLPVPLRLSVAAFVAAGCVAGLVARRELGRFRCPKCSVAIREHEPTHDEPGAPIRYRCLACDVVWDTGLRTPTGL